jgi:hypothetical protein
VRKADNIATSMHRLSGNLGSCNILESYRVCGDRFPLIGNLVLECGCFVSQTVTSAGMFPGSVNVERQDKIDTVYVVVKCRQTDHVSHAFVDLLNLKEERISME